MKRFTSEELVLRFGAVAEEKDPDPDTQATCHCCIKPTTARPKPPKKREALASERDLHVLQRQMAGILGG